MTRLRFLLTAMGTSVASLMAEKPTRENVRQWMRQFDEVVDRARELHIEPADTILVAVRLAILGNSADKIAELLKPLVEESSEELRSKRISE